MQLRIEGLPKPQGSKRVYNGRVVEAAGNALKVWRKAIADECMAQVTEDHKLILGPVRVDIVFYLPRPKTVKEKDRALPIASFSSVDITRQGCFLHLIHRQG